MRNSREDELKRERRSLLGKIERRETAILFAQHDIRKYRERLKIIRDELVEYKPNRTALVSEKEKGRG